MFRTSIPWACVAAACCLAELIIAGSGAVVGDNGNSSTSVQASAEPSGTRSARAPSRTEARDRAEMLHELMHEMLLSVHEHYYREDEGLLIPATALSRVFDRLEERQRIQVRWLAVDAEAMNVEHRPKTDFDHAAVKALKSGKRLFDQVIEKEYHYAGAIRLSSECLKCHVPNRTSLHDRLAGIVIKMPFDSTRE